MAQEKNCLRCGAQIPADAPEGLCLRCLMKVAISEGAEVTMESPRIEGPGMMIGRYKLLELIGEGGMGLVYLAEQQEPIRRRAALKIVKLGMDTKQVIARFEAEKQMLALLDHPNIARVYDAGTTEAGRPYFVMEYVKGQSITEYCDQHKTSIEERLKLFRQVCEGVQHAHQKGIIHRDIKPSNILVSVEGDRVVPKIIDFGIAKAVTQPLTERTLFTERGQLLGTPEYMSPEQVDMATQDIDTRSDIYSLGVVLYQLLAGVLPFGRESFEKGGFAEIQRVIQEVDPPNPSTAFTKLGEEAKKIAEKRKTQVVPLARRLHRELEWIPLKAMRKERVRRYRSASELADDIQNYLNGAPLIAGPETAMYRVKKFVRRHAGSVATVALVAAAIILGLVISSAMYLRAEKALNKEAIARAEAERQAKISQALADFLCNDLLASVRFRSYDSSGDVTLRLAFDAASRSIQSRFEGEPLLEASVREALGNTYWRIGEYEAARPHLERARKIRLEQLGEEHPSTLVSMNNLALLCKKQHLYEEAELLYVKTLEGRLRVLGEEHPDTLACRSDLASVYYYQKRYEKAEPLLVKTLETSRRVLGEDDPQTQVTMGWLALIFRDQGRYEEAEPLYVKMLDIRRRVLGKEYEHEMVTWYVKKELIDLYESWGKPEKAEEWRAKLQSVTTISFSALDKWNELTDALGTKLNQKEVTEEPLPEVNYMSKLAEWYSEQGRYKEAEPLYLERFEIQRRVLGEEHPDVLSSMKDLAGCYYQQGRYDKVKELLVKVLEISRRVHGKDRTFLADFMVEIAHGLGRNPVAELRDGAKAFEAASRACELTYWKNHIYINVLAEVYAEGGDLSSAVKWQKEAIALLPEKEQTEQHRNYQARLKLYQSGNLYHTSFSAGDLVGWWKFDEVKDGNVIDSSGNALNGKLIGDAKIISDPERGNVLSLDGDGDYVDCGDNTTFDIIGSTTISAWIKVNKFDKSFQAIMAKGDTTWELERHGELGSTAFRMYHPTGGESRREDMVLGNVDVNNGKWHHIAGVYDGTKIYLYVDGVLDNFQEAAWLISISEHPVLIGENPESTKRYWNGLIDDVRIYSCALNEAEIKALYAGKDPSLTKESK